MKIKFIKIDDLDKKIGDIAIYFKTDKRYKAREKRQGNFANFGAKTLMISKNIEKKKNIDVYQELVSNRNIDIIKEPIKKTFDDFNTDTQFIKEIYRFVLDKMNGIEDNTRNKQRLANSIVAIIVNYVARGYMGVNKSNRFYGIRTGQLLKSVRASVK